MLCGHGRIEGVGGIGSHLHAAFAPDRVGNMVMFAQVGEGHDIAVAFITSRLVRHPKLDTLDGDAGHDGGQLAHVLVIMFAEEVGEKEMSVFFVFGSREFVIVRLCASLGRHAFRGRFLLGNDRLQFQFAELQVSPQAEQRGSAFDERGIGGKRHVTPFYQLDDFVFLAFVAQFHALRVEVERGVGVVVQVHVDFVAYAAVHAHVDFLFEIESEGLPAVFREARVVRLLQVTPDFQFGGTLGFDTHATGTEYFLGRSQVELHVREVEFVFAFILESFAVLLPVVVLQGLLQAPFLIFFRRHQQRGVQVTVAHFGTDGVIACRRVVNGIRFQIVRVFQVQASFFQIVFVAGRRPLHAETWPDGVRFGRSRDLVPGYMQESGTSHVRQCVGTDGQKDEVEPLFA